MTTMPSTAVSMTVRKRTSRSAPVSAPLLCWSIGRSELWSPVIVTSGPPTWPPCTEPFRPAVPAPEFDPNQNPPPSADLGTPATSTQGGPHGQRHPSTSRKTADPGRNRRTRATSCTPCGRKWSGCSTASPISIWPPSAATSSISGRAATATACCRSPSTSPRTTRPTPSRPSCPASTRRISMSPSPMTC